MLIVSHAHQDHIGCRPALVADGTISVRWALNADPWLGWGRSREDEDDKLIIDSADVRKVVSALREEIYDFRGLADPSVDEFLSDAATLESLYLTMCADLASSDTNIRYFGADSRVNSRDTGSVGERCSIQQTVQVKTAMTSIVLLVS